ncbi:insulinase family protein [Candidatus Uhrbacteria bacterium]|nr:insulinase family protein [Candidatus Uhrbacteria bacterium]
MFTPHLLPNGLRVLLVPTQGTEAVTVLVLTKVGSRYETDEIAGASHFIEHLMFKGTTNRPSAQQISRELDSVGAEYNAYTGKDHTGYYIKIGKNHAKMAVEMVYDMLANSLFDAEEMDKERKVIIEEINMYEDNPIMHVENLLEAEMFVGNTLGRDIAGSRETMMSMARDNVVAFRKAHYIPSRMLLVLSGNVSGDLLPLVEQTFGQLPAEKAQPSAFSPFAFPATRPRSAATQFKDTQQVQLMLAFPGLAMDHADTPALQLLGTIMGGNMSSRLFSSVREKRGLAYMVRARHESYEDAGLFTIHSGLDRSRLAEAVGTIMGEVQRCTSELIEPKELKAARDYIYGKNLLSLEDSADRGEWIGRQALFLDKIRGLEEWIARFDQVTPAQIQALASTFLRRDRMAAAAIGPFKTNDDFLAAANL